MLTKFCECFQKNIEADNEQNRTDYQRTDDFRSAVTKRMFFIRRFAGNLETEIQNYRGKRIGKRMPGISNNGDGSSFDADPIF